MALTPKYLQQCTDGIEKIYWELGTDILVDIASRIKDAKGMTATAEYLNEKLREMGLQQTWINKMLAKVLKATEKEIEQIMDESTYKSTRSTFDLLEKAGYDTTGLSFSDQILQTTNALNGDLQNLTRTTGQLATSTFMNAYDQAYLQVASGAYSTDQAVTNAIKKLAQGGLGYVSYPTGAKRSVEAAVRVAVRTAVAQNALACEKNVIDELGVNLVETSSHIGARPSHAVWQGKVFWVHEPESRYENFYEATGYGTPTGLGGYNCRHQFYPYFEEFGQTYRPIPEEANDAAYQAEQTQRAMERKVREWDRKEKILKAGGQDATEAHRRKQEWTQKLDEHVKASKGFLKRDYSAEKGYGNWKSGTKEKTSEPQRISSKVDISEQNTTLNKEKQSKHMPGGEIFQRHLKKTGRKYSYFILSEEQLEELAKKYAGTGAKQFTKGQKWDGKELIVANKEIIGYVVKRNGEEIATNLFKIHYSKTGIHLVPADPKNGD